MGSTIFKGGALFAIIRKDENTPWKNGEGIEVSPKEGALLDKEAIESALLEVPIWLTAGLKSGEEFDCSKWPEVTKAKLEWSGFNERSSIEGEERGKSIVIRDQNGDRVEKVTIRWNLNP